MKQVFPLLISLLLSYEAHAATLLWDAANTGPLTIERGETPTGPFAMVATVPTGTTQFILTPGAWGHYRVTNSAGASNTAQYSLDLYSGGIVDRLDAVEVRVTALEAPIVASPAPAPTPASNFTTRIIDQDHLEITGTACASMATTGSGTRRVVECRH